MEKHPTPRIPSPPGPHCKICCIKLTKWETVRINMCRKWKCGGIPHVVGSMTPVPELFWGGDPVQPVQDGGRKELLRALSLREI